MKLQAVPSRVGITVAMCITVDDILSSSWLGSSGGNQLPNGRLFVKAGCVDCVPDVQENLMDS